MNALPLAEVLEYVDLCQQHDWHEDATDRMRELQAAVDPTHAFWNTYAPPAQRSEQ